MSKKKVYNLIKKKAEKYKELRTNSKRSMSPDQIMLRYLNEVEEAKIHSNDQWDFNNGLNKATSLMENRLRAFDINVHIDVQWTSATKWQDLSVTGIRIIWSDQYIKEHPNKNKEEHIDIGMLFLDGLFD